MNKKYNIDTAVERLEEISKLEGTELGEAWGYLISLKNYEYCFSDEFNNILEKEIISQAKISDEFEIVEEEVKPIVRTRRILKIKSN